MATIATETKTQILKQVSKRFFEVAADGTLIYQDPIIGRLERAGLQVRVNWAEGQIEIIAGQRVTNAFPLTPSPADACEAALKTYFESIEQGTLRLRTAA